jgi:ankyrin repeat protein
MTLSEAASNGDVEAVRALLAQGADPNEPETEDFDPPLLEAAFDDHVDVARLLLDAGADMYATTGGGQTPLAMALQQGSVNVFRLLLERGCELSQGDDLAWLLTCAAGAGNLEMVRWLLDRGVPVDITDHSGCSALTRAAHAGHMEVMEELLKRGADPNHRDDDTETVLMWAADHPGNASALRLLLKSGADVNARSNVDGTALSWAVRYGDIEMVRELLNADADLHPPYILITAAYTGLTDVVALLVERGADLNVIGWEGLTALEWARKQGHHDVVRLLKRAQQHGAL